MHVNFFLTYYLPRLGGVENAVAYLARTFVAKKHKVEVHVTSSLGYHRNNKLKRMEILNNHLVHRYPCLDINLVKIIGKKQSIPISPLLSLSPLFNHADVNNVHVPHQIIAESLSLSSIISKTPTVLTIHNFEVYKSKLERIMFQALSTMTNLMFNHVDGIIVSSNLFKRRYFSNKFNGKVDVLPFGIDLSKFNLHEPVNSKEKERHPSLLFVSVLDDAHWYKGLGYIIKAMRLLTKERYDISLNVVGKGPLKDYYQSLVKKWGLQDNVKFLGRVSDQKLIELYYNSDVLILPSVSELEGFGLVALEAMACGTPVIVSDICGVSEVVKNLGYGLIISPFKQNSKLILKNWYDKISDHRVRKDFPDVIKNSILKLLDFDWKDKAPDIFNKIKKNYSLNNYATKYLEILEKHIN
ncbi:MAG: glycosyltransferase family 4 protein [Promethearchaeota archaeon]